MTVLLTLSQYICFTDGNVLLLKHYNVVASLSMELCSVYFGVKYFLSFVGPILKHSRFYIRNMNNNVNVILICMN